MLQEQVRVVSGCAANILSSIGIIFLNKYIFSHCQIKTMTLTAIQMAFTSFGLIICLQMNTFVRKPVPLFKVLPLAIAVRILDLEGARSAPVVLVLYL